MAKDKDERKRPQLRLVVDNVEKRSTRPSGSEERFIPFEELVAQRDSLRPEFYRGMDPWQARACERLERFMAGKGWPYGLDPQHGRLLILPAGVVCPEAGEHEGSQQDEVLMYVSEDAAGRGLCLSLEMILPFWSEDDAVMEETFLYAPIFQFGTLFLEENRQDEYLDLIYRLAFPLYPPAPTQKLLGRMFAVAGHELKETLRYLAEYPEG